MRKKSHSFILLTKKHLLAIAGVIFALGLLVVAVRALPQMYAVRGVDVSSYQGDIDWPVLAEQDIAFAFIKATEGSSFTDPYFKSNFDAAVETELLVGAYHFFSYDSGGDTQAANFIAAVPKRAGMLPPVIDVEFYDDYASKPYDPDLARAQLRLMADTLRDYYGVPPILYASGRSYTLYIAGGFEDCPIWIRGVRGIPYVSDFRIWSFWQHSDQGVLDGYSGEEMHIDLNVFRGDLTALQALCLPQSAARAFDPASYNRRDENLGSIYEIAEDGTLYIAGLNDVGQLGNGTVGDSPAVAAFLNTHGLSRDNPVPGYAQLLQDELRPVASNIQHVSCSRQCTYAIWLDGQGTLWGSGENRNGLLGPLRQSDLDHYLTHNASPVSVATPRILMENCLYASAGSFHILALDTDGVLWAWGSNLSGALGNGADWNTIYPTGVGGVAQHSDVLIRVMEDVVWCGAGHMLSAAITADGTLYLWGNNAYGQMGSGGGDGLAWLYDQFVSTPRAVAVNVRSVDLSGFSEIRITLDSGAVLTFGQPTAP